MIEFKRAGDAMVFECVTFRIEVAPGAERIEFKEAGKEIPDTESLIQSAFKVLDMMLEHKANHDSNKKVTEVNFKVNVDTTDAEKAIERLNNYVWKSESGSNPPGHRFREFMKREGL